MVPGRLAGESGTRALESSGWRWGDVVTALILPGIVEGVRTAGAPASILVCALVPDDLLGWNRELTAARAAVRAVARPETSLLIFMAAMA